MADFEQPAPQWLLTALCEPDCQTSRQLTMGGLIEAIERVETHVESSSERRAELERLAASVCGSECGDQSSTQLDVELVLWRWLGAPGHPLVSAGMVADDATMAVLFFDEIAARNGPSCGDTCAARTGDLRQLLTVLANQGLLAGLSPQGPVPGDLIGIGPFWSATEWYPAQALCLDGSGKPRYGRFDGYLACVSPELEPVLRRDVALHELAHVWQHQFNLMRTEDNADCWAHLHGATWFNYVEAGCEDANQRQEVLNAYARSVGAA